MTTLELKLNLPDELVLNARQAGLLKPEAIEAMLREQLKRQAGDALREMWARAPLDEITPEIEQMIEEEIQAARAERRKRSAS